MKSGANFEDQAAIRKLKVMGFEPEEVSKQLRINLETVESFWDFDEAEHQRLAAAQAEAEEAAAAEEKRLAALAALQADEKPGAGKAAKK